MLIRRLAWILIAAAVVALSSCSSKGKQSSQVPRYRFTVVFYSSAGNPFWTKVTAGAKEAAANLGCDVDLQFADGDAVRQNNIIETAIGSRADGIACALNYDDAYDEAIKRAIDAGIPVVCFNIDDSKGARGNARLAYVGQDMQAAGYLIAKRLIAAGNLKAGDFVVCPVEYPEAVYAVQRYAGAKSALEEAGIRSELLNSGGISLEDTLTRLTQYLLGHKDVSAVLALGGMPMEVAPQACEDAKTRVPIAGFDLSRQIAEDIQSGKSLASVDQQPFYQGYMAVTQLYFNKKYGLSPCDINTGGGVVDKSNVKKAIELADSIR